MLAADNLQITNKTIEQAVLKKDPRPIQAIVKGCEAAGADAIDINSGPLLRDPEEKMTFLVNTVQQVCDLPIIIDTANPEALEAGLYICRKKTIINGFSLEPDKLVRILPLAKKYNADIIGYLLYPNGHVPPDGEARLNIAVEILQECKKAGVDENRLIIDPVLVPITWENGKFQAMEVLSVIRTLPDLFGFPVRTIIGLSNLTTGSGHREKKLILERAYLPMLAASGISIVLVNIFHKETIKTAQACKPLVNSRIFAWEEIRS